MRISQAHLAPGMNLRRWQQILRRHHVRLDIADPWSVVSDRVVNTIFEKIASIVKSAREAASVNRLQIEPGQEQIKPVDLYRP
jgi:hypothetical protein